MNPLWEWSKIDVFQLMPDFSLSRVLASNTLPISPAVTHIVTHNKVSIGKCGPSFFLHFHYFEIRHKSISSCQEHNFLHVSLTSTTTQGTVEYQKGAVSGFVLVSPVWIYHCIQEVGIAMVFDNRGHKRCFYLSSCVHFHDTYTHILYYIFEASLYERVIF